MLKQINFSENWNGKLFLKVFTTIRLYNPEKYCDLDLYEVTLRGEVLGVAQLIMKPHYLYKNLNENIALVDTGHSLNYLKNLLTKFYGPKLTENHIFYLLFFKWTDRDWKAHDNLYQKNRDNLVALKPDLTQLHITFND